MTDFSTPFPREHIKRRKKLAIRILAKSVVYAFAIFGILFILLLLAVLGLLRQEAGTAMAVSEQSALQINFDSKFKEIRGDTLLTELSESSPLAFYDLVRAIDVAAADKRIKVLIGQVGNSDLGLAQIEELRAAVQRFRAAGKKTYLFSTGFGAFGNGTSEYYLATAFDEIWLQPNADVGITGIGLEVPFVRGVLDKIGVEPEFYARYEYKTAMASLVDKKMSAPFREEMNKLGGALFEQMVMEIAQARQLTPKAVRYLVNTAPLSEENAYNVGLIDKRGYWQDMLAEVNAAGKLALVEVSNYAATISDNGSHQLIAIISADGVINEGKSIDNPLQGDASVGAETIMAQLDEVAANKNVKAVVLRINSPGGSYTASNAIWYALKKFKADKKVPLIVSMGDYAASGGYFIALAGDKLVAEPSTITGSIGVLGGKMVLAGLWDKLGVNWQGIKFGDNAGILSPNQKFSESEKILFNKSLDRVYEDFTLKVSEARKFDKAKIEQVARGRVWTGAGALEVGLIDELGGFDKAFELAKSEAGIKAGDKFGIAYYPKQKSLSEKISEILNSAPTVSMRKIMADFGVEHGQVNVLQRLNYDLMMIPVNIAY